MQRNVRLRPWQKTALDRFLASPEPDFLAVATPGAGKTTFALAAALRALADRSVERVVVVAPTAHLKTQWAQAAARFGIQLDPAWSAASGGFSRDMHGIVTTYQQVATSAEVLARITGRSFVILDELHHAGDERAWGDAVRTAFEPAARRLALSGTPFRSDTRSIPFVRYTLEEASADFEYGYADALRDGGVVRPVYFPRINGFMEWVAPDGSLNAASFDDALDATKSAQRLRTALSAEGEWLPAVISQAHERLEALRRDRQPDAGGLVIAADQDHARAIADLMRWRLGVHATIALSDDPNASDRIAHFAAGKQPWLIAVRMVSEGVDIPRLAIGVYASTTTTELFFRQAVGRFVRWTRGVRRQKAYLFIPDDPRLRTYASQIADARRHSLRKRAEDAGNALDGQVEGDPAALDSMAGEPDEQLSLFSALSAVITDGPHPVASVFDDDFEDLHEPDDLDAVLDGAGDPGADGLVLDLDKLLPPLPSGGSASATDGSGLSRYEQKEALRVKNADVVADIVRYTMRSHAEVNSQLNRQVGITKIKDATVEQLARRLKAAEQWLQQTMRR